MAAGEGDIVGPVPLFWPWRRPQPTVGPTHRGRSLPAHRVRIIGANADVETRIVSNGLRNKSTSVIYGCQLMPAVIPFDNYGSDFAKY